MFKNRPIAFFFIATFIGLNICVPSLEAKSISFIRDAETENTIRNYSAPVFKVAGLNPEDIKIYIVNDNTLNAFVAGGQKLFINTGLLFQSSSANQVIGVIAHETGHISGGHLVRTHDALAKSNAQSILTMIIGGITGITTGRGDVGAAIIMGSQTSGVRNFLLYSRTQEGSADQAALKFLDLTEQSSLGLLQFMEKLGEQELLSAARQDPYVRSHPLSRDRIKAIAKHVSISPYSEKRDSPQVELGHNRIKAKLYAYLNSYAATLRLYKENDNSIPSRYARAVALYRRGNLDDALVLINGLLAEFPEDPYFHELKGQMLFESQHPQEALLAYKRALQFLPAEPLLLREVGRILLALGDPRYLDEAIKTFQTALELESDTPSVWRQLAIAYGRKGEKGFSALSLAEEALLLGDSSAARYHGGLASTLFAEGTSQWLQSQDILMAADEIDSHKKNNQN